MDVTDIQTGVFKRFWCAELGVSFTKDGASYSCVGGGYSANGKFIDYETAYTKVVYKEKVSNYDITVDECFRSVDKEKSHRKKNNRHTHCSKNIFLHQEPAINNMFKDHPLYQARISK